MKATTDNKKILWQMYIWSGIKALSEQKDGDGVVILRTEKGNEYCFPVYRNEPFVDVMTLTDTLRKAEDIRVCYLTMMWNNHWLDVPPCVLRKALIELTLDNAEVNILLIGEENFLIRTLNDFDKVK